MKARKVSGGKMESGKDSGGLSTGGQTGVCT